MAFEIRVPMAMVFGRLRPTAVRVFRAAPEEADGHDRAPRTSQPAPRDEDVELAVREHLYGTRPNGQRR
jgi:hypothetical protein